MKKLKLEFAPGCFDNIEGLTQEELDAFVKDLQELVESGKILVEYRDWETDRKSTRLNSSH